MQQLCDWRANPLGITEFYRQATSWKAIATASNKVLRAVTERLQQIDSLEVNRIRGPALLCSWVCHRAGQKLGKSVGKQRTVMTKLREAAPSKMCDCPGRARAIVFVRSGVCLITCWHAHNHESDDSQWALATGRLSRIRTLKWMVEKRMRAGATDFDIRKFLSAANFSLDARHRSEADKLLLDSHVMSITRNDIANFRKKLGLGKNLRSKNDATATRMLFEEWTRQYGSDCPIVYLKFGGESPDEPYSKVRGGDLQRSVCVPSSQLARGSPSEAEDTKTLPNDEFVCVFMSKEGAEMLSKLTQHTTVLHTDDTHKTQDYGYHFLTLLVPDNSSCGEKGPGRAGAYCITSVDDKNPRVWSLFGSVVQQAVAWHKLKPLSPDVLMVDCTSAAYEGLKLAIISLAVCLWCAWHVMKNWRDMLRFGCQKSKLRKKENGEQVFR